MTELPEVETIRRELERDVVGKKIKTVEVNNNRSIRRHANRKQFKEKLEGTKITGLSRKGKYLVAKLDSDDLLVVHLGLNGQLLRLANKKPAVKHTQVVIGFTQGGQLRFVDPQASGELFVTAPDELGDIVPEITELGIDPVDQPVSWVEFGKLLRANHMKIKSFLTDQTIIAGIGNVYSDEILHASGLRYDRISDELSTQEIRRLYRSLVETLHDAIKHGGSTLEDDEFVNTSGEPGGYQEFHEVYARDKQPCRRCRSTVTKARFAGNSTYFCPQCQV